MGSVATATVPVAGPAPGVTLAVERVPADVAAAGAWFAEVAPDAPLVASAAVAVAVGTVKAGPGAVDPLAGPAAGVVVASGSSASSSPHEVSPAAENSTSSSAGDAAASGGRAEGRRTSSVLVGNRSARWPRPVL